MKDAHKAQNIAGIDAATTELNNALQAAAQDIYNAQNAGAQQQAGANAQQQQQTSNNNSGDNVTDVDFEEVK